MRCLTRALLILLIAVVSSVGLSQDKPAGVVEFNEFNAKPVDGWDWDDDERLEDLVLQLQQKELTLQALDSRIAKATGRKAGAKMDENMAWRSNLRMDLNAGGPVRWDAFYGRNAENFFYHPVDPNTTYHTTTALQQVTPTSAGGVPGNQGVPAHQRPPQFDYIYRGYEKKQAKAQELARELASKVEEMTSRRRQLEAEVVLLWFKLAFRVIDRDKIPEKTVLRFAVMPKNGNGKDDMERAVALSEATQLLAIALLFNEPRVESEPDKVFRTVGTVIQKQRKKFEDSLIRLGSVVDDSEDKTMPIGKYKFLARKLEDTSKSLSEGYGGWKDGDQADDEPTKFTGLRRVQDSVVRYSKICLALNELVDLMKKEWGMRINTDSTEFVPQWDVAYVARPTSVPTARSSASVERAEDRKSSGGGRASQLRQKSATDAVQIGEHFYKVFPGQLSWYDAKRACEAMGGYLACLEDAEEQKKVGELKGNGKVVWVGGFRNQQGNFVWVNGKPLDARRVKVDDPNFGFVGFAVDLQLNVRPVSGTADFLIKNIQGFVCEWDE